MAKKGLFFRCENAVSFREDNCKPFNNQGSIGSLKLSLIHVLTWPTQVGRKKLSLNLIATSEKLRDGRDSGPIEFSPTSLICQSKPCIPVVPGQAGGGSFQKEKNYIAQKEFAYRMCARGPTSAMPKSFLCCERAFCRSMVVMFCALKWSVLMSWCLLRGQVMWWSRHLMRCNGLCCVMSRDAMRCHGDELYYSSTTLYYKVLLQYYSVLQILLCTTPVLPCTTKYYSSTTPVLPCTAKYYSSTNLHYKVLLQYYSVLQSTTPVLTCTTKYYSTTTLYYKVLLQYYSVLQSTTPILLGTTKYDSNTSPYYKYYSVLLQCYPVLQSTTQVLLCTTPVQPCKVLLQYYPVLQVLLQYYSVLQSTTPILLCTTKYDSNTSPYYKYYSVLLQCYPVLQSTTQVLLCTTPVQPCKVLLQYYPVLQSTSWLIRITYETSFTMRRATGITLQPHQILRLPRKMNLMIDRRRIWNVIYNTQSNRHHPPSSPNTAPATQNESHDWSISHMKRHLQ